MRRNIGIVIIAVIIVAIIGISVSMTAIMQCGNPKEYTVVDVTIQAEIQTGNNGENIESVSTHYLYFCKIDSGEIIVFENEDSLLNGKFNSSTLLAQINSYQKEGKPFKVYTRGYRIPFLSTYQNIIKIEELEIEE